MDENVFSGPVGNVAAKVIPFSRYSDSGAANTAQNAAADAMVEKLAAALGGGTASDARIAQVHGLMFRPGDTAKEREEKHKVLNGLLDTQLRAYRQQQQGVGFKVAPPSTFPTAKPTGFK